MTVRLSRRKLKLGLELLRADPTFAGRMALRWLNRLYHRRGYRSAFNEAGVDVFDRDWDTLLLLDACRREMLEEHPFDGEYTTVTSRGSDTFEFLAANCADADLRDTVYVSASPMLDWHDDAIDQNFHDVIFVWEERGWDDETRTVLPSDVYDVALQAAATYPNKRLFVHFLQPHYPFVDSGTEWDKQQLHDPDDETPSFWRLVETGQLDLSPDRLWDLYERNLDAVLPYAERLVDDLEGKTVITSDHANMFGERATPIPIPEWGHPAGTYTDELVTVPWIECDAATRKRVVADDPVQDRQTGADRDDLRARLADLGYAT